MNAPAPRSKPAVALLIDVSAYQVPEREQFPLAADSRSAESGSDDTGPLGVHAADTQLFRERSAQRIHEDVFFGAVSHDMPAELLADRRRENDVTDGLIRSKLPHEGGECGAELRADPAKRRARPFVARHGGPR